MAFITNYFDYTTDAIYGVGFAQLTQLPQVNTEDVFEGLDKEVELNQIAREYKRVAKEAQFRAMYGNKRSMRGEYDDR